MTWPPFFHLSRHCTTTNTPTNALPWTTTLQLGQRKPGARERVGNTCIFLYYCIHTQSHTASHTQRFVYFSLLLIPNTTNQPTHRRPTGGVKIREQCKEGEIKGQKRETNRASQETSRDTKITLVWPTYVSFTVRNQQNPKVRKRCPCVVCCAMCVPPRLVLTSCRHEVN